MYRNMETFVRGIQRVGSVLKHGTKIIQNSPVRLGSTVAKSKIIEGSNGERIFSSPYGEVDLPSVTVTDFVWKNYQKWPERVAVVRI